MTPRTSHAVAVTAVALLSAPLALAAPIEIGDRNPAGGSDAPRETQIIAETARGTYGTRQSNKGEGGGAIYGCRSSLNLGGIGNPDLSTPCVRVNNLTGGKAFDFVFDSGPVGGLIQSGSSIATPNPRAAPFVTNATAIAAGLNADRLDNKQASEIIAEARARPGLDSEKVGGLTPAQIVAVAQTGGGLCDAGLVVAGDACIEQAPRAAATFDAAAAVCGKAGRHLPTASVLTYARTLDGIDLGAGEMASDVSATQALPLPEPLGSATSQTVYATVADTGAIASSPIGEATPYRCAQG